MTKRRTPAELAALRAQIITNMHVTVANELARQDRRKHGGRRPGAGRPLEHGPEAVVTTTVTLRPDQLERMDQLIADTGRSRSSIIRDALDAWMMPVA